MKRVLAMLAVASLVGCIGDVLPDASNDDVVGGKADGDGPRCAGAQPAIGYVVDDVGHHAVSVFTLPLGIPGDQPMAEASARAFRRVVFASGYQISLAPGGYAAFRHHEDQRALYDSFVSGTGNFAMVPDWSNHQRGTAIDVSAGLPWLRAWGACFGWFRPWPSYDEVIRGMGQVELEKLARDLWNSPRYADPSQIEHAGCAGQLFSYGPYFTDRAGDALAPDRGGIVSRDALARFTRDALRCESWHWEYDRTLELVSRDTDACRALTEHADDAALGGYTCLRTPDDLAPARCDNRCFVTGGHANVNDTDEGCAVTGTVASDTDGRACYACTSTGWEASGGSADVDGRCP